MPSPGETQKKTRLWVPRSWSLRQDGVYFAITSPAEENSLWIWQRIHRRHGLVEDSKTEAPSIDDI